MLWYGDGDWGPDIVPRSIKKLTGMSWYPVLVRSIPLIVSLDLGPKVALPYLEVSQSGTGRIFFRSKSSPAQIAILGLHQEDKFVSDSLVNSTAIKSIVWR